MQSTPLWGEHPFEIEAKGKNVLIKGELAKQLQNLKGSSSLKVRLKNDSQSVKDLRKEGEDWFIVGVINREEAFKLEPKMVKEKRQRAKRNENGEVEKGKDGKEIMEDYVVSVDKSREHLEEVLKANRDQLKKIGRPTRKKEAEIQVAERKEAAKVLYRAVKEATPRTHQGKVQSDWEFPEGSPQLIKFTEDLLNRSDSSRRQQENEKKKNEVLSTIRFGLQVWTGKGTNEKERHLLLEGKSP